MKNAETHQCCLGILKRAGALHDVDLRAFGSRYGAMDVRRSIGFALVQVAHDAGQSDDPLVSRWYKSLMMPDNPTISCCGSADAYYADVFETDGDRYVAVITDTREDGPLARHHSSAPGLSYQTQS